MLVIAVLAFFGGLLLAVRVMLFGVQRRVDEEHIAHRRWPLALAAFLTVAGAMLYVLTNRTQLAPPTVALVLGAGVVAGAGAWWLVQRSASIPSTDPEDDPRFRFQGHVARVVEPIGDGPGSGRIVFEFDGRQHDFVAHWCTAGEWAESGQAGRGPAGVAGAEVVIEIVEGNVAYVEPWTVVEQRL